MADEQENKRQREGRKKKQFIEHDKYNLKHKQRTSFSTDFQR